jgi:hypothetical protein
MHPPRLSRLWLAGLIAAALAATAPPAARAAVAPSGENITASPTQIKLDLAPGTTASGIATVINDGDRAYDFKAYATPYHVAGEDYDPSFTTTSGQDASHWIRLTDQTLHLLPHQTTTVPYTVTVPAGTGGGGYYAAMFFETLPRAIAGSGVMSKQRVGMVVYLRIAGAITEHGTIESFTVSPLQKGPPVTAALRLGNQGNVHYTADITEHITDLLGHPKADIHVVREVLPHTTRRFVLAWDKAPLFGLFRINGAVNLLGRTETLPTHYVLVLSAAAFLGMAAALLLLIVLAVWWWVGHSRRRPA